MSPVIYARNDDTTFASSGSKIRLLQDLAHLPVLQPSISQRFATPKCHLTFFVPQNIKTLWPAATVSLQSQAMRSTSVASQSSGGARARL